MRKKLKGLICCLLIFMLMLSSAIVAGAKDEERQIFQDHNYIFEMFEDNTISILFYIGTATKVTIPKTIGRVPVKSVGTYAFYDTDVTDITISEGITTIDDEAFFYCKKLESVTLPSTLESVGTGAFRYCPKLKKVTFSKDSDTMGKYMFYGCTSLENVNLPQKITEIPEGAFSYCQSLSSISLHEGITEISSYAFYAAGLTEIKLPDSLEYIYSQAFANNTSLSKVISSKDDFEYISDGAFEGCKVTFPENEPSTATDPTETTIITDPTESTAPTETTIVTDPTESTALTEPSTATDPTESTALTEPSTATDPTESTALTEPSTATDPTYPIAPTEPDATFDPPVVNEVITIYFTNNKRWEEVYIYHWGNEGMNWPGVPMEFLETNTYGEDIYKAEIPANTSGVVFNNNNKGEQTKDVVPKDGIGVYCIGEESPYDVDYYEHYNPTVPSPPSENTGGYEGDMIGDVNLDGIVSVSDVTLIKKYVADFYWPDDEEEFRKKADADLNGDVNVKDATFIQKYIVGIKTAGWMEEREIPEYTPKYEGYWDGISVGGSVYSVRPGDVITYEVTLIASKFFEDIQAFICYDSSALELVRGDYEYMEDEAEVIFPVLRDDVIFNADNPGVVQFNASYLKGYNFRYSSEILLTLDFVVKDTAYSEIYLVVEEMTQKGDGTEKYFYKGKPVIEEGIINCEYLSVPSHEIPTATDAKPTETDPNFTTVAPPEYSDPFNPTEIDTGDWTPPWNTGDWRPTEDTGSLPDLPDFFIGSLNGFQDFENSKLDETGGNVLSDKEKLADLAWNVRLKGDANDDNEVNIRDATVIQKYVASLISINSPDFNYKNSDADTDGRVTVKDATTIQKHIVGKIEL